MPLPEGPFARRTARILLLNKENRLLLFKYRFKHRSEWLTPGGGVDAGEALDVAAARELWEETGLVVAPADLGTVVAATGGHADFKWVTGTMREDYFLHRVEQLDIDDSGLTDYERKTILEHRWWSVADLEATDEYVVPWGLAPLLASILRDGAPENPVELPWHH